MLGISHYNLDVIKYLGGIHNNLRRYVILFKPRTIYESYVEAHYLENMVMDKGQPSGSNKNTTKMLQKREIRSEKENIRK